MPRRCSLNRSIVLKALATSCPPIMTAAAACILASRHRTHAVFMRSRGLGALFPDHLRWHRLVGSAITYYSEAVWHEEEGWRPHSSSNPSKKAFAVSRT